ncbi:hypothetical protein F5148DRAFT_858945 [Russula earlei]|uniref:Uncharacterized protein n=1 Tax=Russula earlei TaxID=71964 RepID=A0ACC0TT55_9AGAM|nr:hypothetical protein F5148DRAFT_858945 [Russula earlei]
MTSTNLPMPKIRTTIGLWISLLFSVSTFPDNCAFVNHDDRLTSTEQTPRRHDLRDDVKMDMPVLLHKWQKSTVMWFPGAKVTRSDSTRHCLGIDGITNVALPSQLGIGELPFIKLWAVFRTQASSSIEG